MGNSLSPSLDGPATHGEGLMMRGKVVDVSIPPSVLRDYQPSFIFFSASALHSLIQVFKFSQNFSSISFEPLFYLTTFLPCLKLTFDKLNFKLDV